MNPVHKRREARGLTSIGKQVGVHLDSFIQRRSYFSFRTVVSTERDTVTTTPLLAPPGRSTTLSASAATVDCFFLYFFHSPTHHALRAMSLMPNRSCENMTTFGGPSCDMIKCEWTDHLCCRTTVLHRRGLVHCPVPRLISVVTAQCLRSR